MPPFTRTATFWIAAATALVSLLLIGGLLGPHTLLQLAFIPARLSGLALPFAQVPAILTPLTATLVHGGFSHLFFNLFMLLLCGLAVERVLGKGGLIFLYVASAYVSMLAQWAANPMEASPIIGASGAISGVVGAYALSFSRPRRVTENLRLNRWINILWLAAAWTVLQVVIGWSAGQQGMFLATPAHVGGFLAGMLLQRPLLLWRYRKA